MKTLILALALSFAALPAFAEIRKQASLDKYAFNYKTDRPMTVKITITYKTKDGCNHFGLTGDFRRLEVPGGGQTLLQDYVADFGVMGTLIGCADKEERTIVMESDPLVIEPISGYVMGSIAVPAGAKVTMQ
jgi:hypothetical protein